MKPAPWLRFAEPLPLLVWDIALFASAAVTAMMIALSSPPPTTVETIAGIATLFAAIICYFTFARRGLLPDHNGVPLQVSLGLITAAGCVFSGNLVWFQLFLYPAIWISSTTVGQALIANVLHFLAITTAYGFGLSTTYPQTSGDLVVHYAFQAVSLLFSVTFGLWLTWLMAYSVERAELLAEVSAAQTELQSLSRKAGAAKERKRISRDLNDAIAQSLVSQVMLAQKLQRELAETHGAGAAPTMTAELLEEIAGDALREARILIADDADPAPTETSLNDAVAMVISRFEKETGIVVRQSVTPTIGSLATRELEVVMLRVVQEGLANVRKHAQASAVSVSIQQDRVTSIEVRDDGIGLGRHLDARPGVDSGFGLTGMRDRVALVQGTIMLTPGSGPPERPGTVLRVELPSVPEEEAP